VTFVFSKFPPCGRSSIVDIPLFFTDVEALCDVAFEVTIQEPAEMMMFVGLKRPGFVSINICGIDAGGNSERAGLVNWCMGLPS
jgi:hypothetical protein